MVLINRPISHQVDRIERLPGIHFMPSSHLRSNQLNHYWLQYLLKRFPSELLNANLFPEPCFTGNNISAGAILLVKPTSSPIPRPCTSGFRISIVRLTSLMVSKASRVIFQHLTSISKFLNIERLEDGLLLKAGMSCSLRKIRRMWMRSGILSPV